MGALPVGTQVNCIEKIPGSGGFFIHAAGAVATILRKINDRVIVKMPSKLEISFNERCMATVGKNRAQYDYLHGVVFLSFLS